MSIAYSLILLIAQNGAGVDAAEFRGDVPECAEPMTQQAMNYCASLEWQEADESLSAQWRVTAAEMRRLDAEVMPDDERPGYFGQLLRGQRAWLVYRDHHCASVGYHARGGSLEPLLVATCKTELTPTRTAQLRGLAEYPN